ncbi:ABC transporter permease [Halovenus salina]|nr:ABC transporter permease [Halovenus salina]
MLDVLSAGSFISVQGLLDGLTVGMVYVLLAAGLSVIFGVMHVINFAHGELYAFGAYFAAAIVTPLGGGLGFYVALVVAPLLVGVMGVAIERFTVRPLYGRDPLYHILLTFGLVLVLNDLIKLIWGTSPRRIARPDYLTGTVDVLGATFSRYSFFIIGFGGALALGVWALLKYTRYGLIIRAGAQDRRMVRNLGISIDRYYSLVFGAGAALAAVAGIVFTAGRGQVVPGIGFDIIIAAFVIVVLGGLGSFRGAVVGGLGVGVLQETIINADIQISLPLVPGGWLDPVNTGFELLGQLEGMVIFVLMIGVLIARPRGLFGSEFEDEGGELLTGSTGGLLAPDTRFKLGAVMIVLLALVPLGVDWLYSTFMVTLVMRMLTWGLFALALDFIMGYTGLVSLGHALFWGLGAYVSGAVLFNFSESVFVAAAAALVVGGVVAWLVGYFSIRVHGVYFAMITLAFAELFHTSLTKIDGWVVGFCETTPVCSAEAARDIQLTGGSEGLFGFSSYWGLGGMGVELEEIGVFLGPVTLTGDLLLYYIVLAVLIMSFLITRRMLQSPFGAVLKGIRENEQRVRFLGYDPTVYKRRAFVVSGIFATLAGVIFAINESFVAPSAVEWLKSGEVVVMVILGGMGTLFGPILGAFTFFGLEQLLQEQTLFEPFIWLGSMLGVGGPIEGVAGTVAERWRLFLGLTFVVFVIFLPRGMVSLPELFRERLPPRFKPSTNVPAEPEGGDD